MTSLLTARTTFDRLMILFLYVTVVKDPSGDTPSKGLDPSKVQD